jgi:hypothetical protein
MGIPCEGWVANERDRRGVRRKDESIRNARAILTEGMVFLRDKKGEIELDPDGVPRFDPAKPFGALRLPAAWTIVGDQLSILREEDERQRKDAAMAVIQGLDFLYRIRRARTHQDTPIRFSVFSGAPDLSAR